MKTKSKYFTLVELVVVISIIASLLGITLVSVNLAKKKAKHTRWLAYNTMLNKDPDIVLNFNFADTSSKIPVKTSSGAEIMQPALMNNAAGSTVPGFELSKTHGFIKNSTFLQRGGRNRFHSALAFDGRRSYVEIPNSDAINFNPETTDFTILTWIRFDRIGTGVICGKAEWQDSSQYTLYTNGNGLEADVGRNCTAWKNPPIKTNEWYHIALVSEGGKFQIYQNGAPMTNPIKGKAAPKFETSAPLLLGSVMTTANKTTPRYYFSGRMDEFVLLRKAIKPEEVKHHYQAGNYQ